ncbi:hypothetical protein ACQ4PT_018107 [Festuca glaucescens]
MSIFLTRTERESEAESSSTSPFAEAVPSEAERNRRRGPGGEGSKGVDGLVLILELLSSKDVAVYCKLPSVLSLRSAFVALWLLVSSYNINTYDVVTFFFDPEDLEVPDEYEVDVCDMNKNLKEWAVDTSVGFSCKHVIPLYRETLHKIVFSDIADISEEDMCEINWVLVKERKFYYTMNKDEDFFELDQFFVHRMKEDDVNFLEKRRKLLQNGGEDDIDAAPRATSRYCLSHLFEVIKCVRNCSRKTKLVSDIGFGDILQLDECIVPRAFAQWLADVCTFDDDDSIVIQSTVIMNPGSVKDTFAIPCGELPIAIEDEDGKLAFIAQFALTDVPPIKYFGRMAMSDDLSDDVFKRCFMAVTLGSFLCPTSSTKPSTKYLGALVDVDNIKFLNWCKLVHDWLVCYINKYKKDKMKANKMSLTLGGCIYHIAVRYLDFVEFGSIMLLATLPRIRVWKGDLIKHFSNMVIVRTGSYNSYHVKDVSRTCYDGCSDTSTNNAENNNLGERINSIVGNFFSQKVTEGICLCLQRHLSEQDQNTCAKIEYVVIDVLKCISSEYSESGGTLKIESSAEHISYNNNVPNNNEQEIDHQAPNGNRKRTFHDRECSAASAASLSRKTARTADVHCASRLKRHLNLNLHDNPIEVLQPVAHKELEKIPSICQQSASFSHMIHRNVSFNPNDPSCSTILHEVISCKETIPDSGSTDDTPAVKSHVNFVELSKKYFFNDNDIPAFRFFNYVDDNGKTIDEPELWHPLAMGHEEYALKIKEATIRATNGTFEEEAPEMCDDSIQCAQKQTTVTSTPHEDHVDKEAVINIDSKSSEVVCLGERMNRDVTLSPEIEFMGERPARITSISQEVQILGERSFNNVCNDMSNKTDDLYNAGLSLGNKSVSSGKENLRPKRVVNRSSYLCSPFDINNTSRIEPHEMKLYETITTLCDDPNYQNKWVVNMNNCRCTLKQLGCSMKQGGWVEAWVINAICRKLFKDKHPRQSQKHFFFHTSSEYFLEKWPNEYMKEIWRTNVIKGFQGADSARKLHLSERLNFPSLYDRHWFLFVVDMKARKFLFMDSLFGEHSDLHQEVDDKIITNFTRTWEECNLKEIHFETFGKLYPNLPKQKTPNDCEIFLIKYMEWYCTRNPKACSFSAKDIPEFRVKLAVDTLFNDYNSAIPEMDLISTFDLEEVLRSLNVEETGLASFYVNDYGYHPNGAYYTTSDVRMKFESCWAEFVKEYDMEAGNIILILFHMEGTGVINISVDRI